LKEIDLDVHIDPITYAGYSVGLATLALADARNWGEKADVRDDALADGWSTRDVASR